MRVALEMQAASDEALQGRLAESQARKFIANVYERVNRKPLPSASLDAYFTKWLGRKEKEVGQSTIGRYRNTYKNVKGYLKKGMEWSIVHFDKDVITDFRDYIAKRSSTMHGNMEVKVLKAMLQDAFRDGLVPTNEAMKVRTLKRDVAAFKRLPFTMAQVKLILGLGTLTQQWRGMVLMGLYTGQRLGDIATATWGELDLVKKAWAFKSRKTGRNMIVPIHPVLQKHLEAVRPTDPAADDPVFPEANGAVQRTGKTGMLSRDFHNILAEVGLATKQSFKSTGKGRKTTRTMSPLTFHSFRGTLTSILKQMGVSQGVAQDIIGHDTPSISDHYTSIDEATKRLAIDKLPDVTA